MKNSGWSFGITKRLGTLVVAIAMVCLMAANSAWADGHFEWYGGGDTDSSYGVWLGGGGVHNGGLNSDGAMFPTYNFDPGAGQTFQVTGTIYGAYHKENSNTAPGGSLNNYLYHVQSGTFVWDNGQDSTGFDDNYKALHFQIDAGATMMTTVDDWFTDNEYTTTQPKVFGEGTYIRYYNLDRSGQAYRDQYGISRNDWISLNHEGHNGDGSPGNRDNTFARRTGDFTYFTGKLLYGKWFRIGVSNAFADGQRQFYDATYGGNWTLGVVQGGQLFVGYQSSNTVISRNLYLEGSYWECEHENGIDNGALRFHSNATITGDIEIGADGAMISSLSDAKVCPPNVTV